MGKRETLSKAKQSQHSILYFLPHARQRIEQAFQEWQAITVERAFEDTPIANGPKGSTFSSSVKKAMESRNLDAKQPFRPEQRYRRR